MPESARPSREDLLGALYEGPLEDPPWSGFLESLRCELGAVTATFILRSQSDPHLGLVVSRGLRRFESAYREQHWASDPFVNLTEGQVTTLDDVVSREALQASEFYRQLLAPAGILHVLGVDLREGALHARLRVSRGADAAAFGVSERAWLADLVPHLRRSLRIHDRIAAAEGERDVYAGALDPLAQASFLLDEAGRVISRGDPTSLPVPELLLRGQRLVTPSAAGTRRLSQAIERALAARQGRGPALVEALRLGGGRSGRELAVLIRPLPADAGSPGRPRPALALFVADPERREEIPAEVVRGLFDLTPAEAGLAVRLARGLALDDAARELGIARNTARAHLRAIFDKAGVTRQAELVARILRSVASLGSGRTKTDPRR